ncbi:MAG TPA: HIG1 domain-containing protein [Burkholderiales bacterium]|nr:HIG1 domain-containing protein [Burkholderiales bacterium]
MTVFATLALLAALAAVAALTSGITAMAHHGEVGHRSSEEWMVWRVVFQAAAILVILSAIIAS